MNYQETIDFLYTKLPMYQRLGPAALKFSLDNILELMARLNNPHKKVKTIHVGGTNGKGSSSHMLSSILQEAGFKVGLFTSPHLKSFTERARVNGEEIPEEAVVRFVEKIERTIDDIQPSFFEITFAMAMWHFYEEQVDFAVIEVGLGGRLDSTNVITPEISLITNISLDHTFLLGNRLSEIATEKAGIIKSGVPVIIGEYQEEVANVFTEKAEVKGSQLEFASKAFHIEQTYENRINIIENNEIKHEGLTLDLKGAYQIQNAISVISVINKLNNSINPMISDTDIRLGLANVAANTGLKGRWQIIKDHPLTILDTGHNIAGIQQIVEQLSKLKFNDLHIVWGMVDDKEISNILELLPRSATYYFVNADVPRAFPAKDLKSIANDQGLEGNNYLSVMLGYNAAKEQTSADDLIFVGGSTFVVAEIEDL